MTNTDKLMQMFSEVENTPGFQLHKIIIDLTEQICEIMEEKGINKPDLARILGKPEYWVTKMLEGDPGITLRTIVNTFWELGYKIEVVSTQRDK